MGRGVSRPPPSVCHFSAHHEPRTVDAPFNELELQPTKFEEIAPEENAGTKSKGTD